MAAQARSLPTWMPDLLAEALALPGLWPLIAITFVAGIVYGFAGFGAGRRLFDPARKLLYTRVAFGIIAVSVVMGLPVWS